MQETETPTQDALRVLTSLAESLQAIRDDFSITPSASLTNQFAHSASDLARVMKNSAQQRPDEAIRSMKNALEKAVPLFRNTYGDDTVISNLSFLAKDQRSIDVLHSIGAKQSADLSQEARRRRDAEITGVHTAGQDPAMAQRIKDVLKRRTKYQNKL
jgi:hypothetical protein